MAADIADLLIPAAFTLAFLALVIVPLERVHPRRRQPFLRREWWTDLAFFAGQQLVWRGVALAALGAVGGLLDAHIPEGFRADIANMPIAVQAILTIFLCDLTVYWGHRLSHSLPFLWRFHRVHHTSVDLDWLAAYREHPVDGIYTMLLENLPALLLGFRLEAIAGFIILRGVWAVFIHSNVRLPLGPLKYILGSPELHHWHHHVGHGGYRNFANLMPLMDLIFGTYYAPKGQDPERLGTDEPVPHDYLRQLAHPFVELARLPLRAGTRLVRACVRRASPASSAHESTSLRRPGSTVAARSPHV